MGNGAISCKLRAYLGVTCISFSRVLPIAELRIRIVLFGAETESRARKMLPVLGFWRFLLATRSHHFTHCLVKPRTRVDGTLKPSVLDSAGPVLRDNDVVEMPWNLHAALLAIGSVSYTE